jgi:Iap family predicted aminopeptidase
MILKGNKRIYFAFGLCLQLFFCAGQNRDFAQKTIDQLCTDSFAGRGYINMGDYKAATYIANQFKEIGLSGITENYFQSFSLNVNTIPLANLSLDSKELVPGYDFLVSPGSSSSNISSPLYFVPNKKLESKRGAKLVSKVIKKGCVPVLDIFDAKNEAVVSNLKAIYSNTKLETIGMLKPSMFWSVARSQLPICEVWIVDSIFNRKTKQIDLKVDANFKENYQTQNVVGIVPGTVNPDSFIIFCGHYDHLGKMGEAIFYGANDNASGIAMLLDMANYFVAHPQKYSIVFIAFAAEEAGLVGSKYYVGNPPKEIPLSNTKFVFNMDLMGNGKDGATVVNSTVFENEFQLLNEINNENKYLPILKTRGKAANSDHYYFTEAGIPSFFMYTMGDYNYYHIPNDNAQNLELGPFYDKTFLLIRDFIIALNN